LIEYIYSIKRDGAVPLKSWYFYNIGVLCLYKNREKVFKSITEQIDLLKSKNLEFDNKIAAAQQLSNYGCFEIINS